MRIRCQLLRALITLLVCGPGASVYASDWVYYARAGDTLWDLCLEYTNKRGCWIELAKYNGVRNDRAIPIGEEIRIPTRWLTRPPVVGGVVAVTGVVNYHQGRSTPAVPLRVGQDLHLGARLVSAEGSARLTLGPGNELLLRANSTLELDTMSGPAARRSTAELTLPRGAVELKVVPDSNSRFRIQTPAAIAAVRGTQYRVNSVGIDGKSMRSEVLSGSVEVAADKDTALVPAGFGVATKKGESPGPPRKLLAAPAFARSYSAVTLPAVIEWEADPAGAGWLLDLLEPGRTGALLASYPTDKPRLVFESLDEGCYVVKLRAIDGDGFNGLDRMAPLCIVPRLKSPARLAEITQGATENSMRLSWSPVAGAERYRLEIATDNSFAEILQAQLTSSTEMAFRQSANEPFSVRVIAIDAAGNESDASQAGAYQPPREFPWDGILMGAIMLLFAL